MLKKAPRGYPYNGRVPDDATLSGLVALASDTDEKVLPVLDSLIELRCNPARVAEVLGMKEVRHNVLNASGMNGKR